VSRWAFGDTWDDGCGTPGGQAAGSTPPSACYVAAVADSSSTSSSTSSTIKQTFTSRLPLITWLTIAVVFLVAITIRGDSNSATNDAASDPATASATDEAASGDAADAAGSDEASTGDGDASSGDGADSSADGSAASGATDPDDGDDPPTSDPDGEGSAAPPASTVTATLPTTTVAGVTPPATTVAGAAPQTTTVVTPPPTTIVVTAPPTTIRVTLPPTTTTIAPPVTEGCSLLGTDEFGDITIELTVVSPTSAVSQLEVGFELTDVEGEVFLPDFQVVEYVAPGEVIRLTILTFEPVPPGNDLGSVNCTITSVESIELFEDQFVAGPSDTCSVIGVDEIGDVQVDVTVQNPDVEAADLVFTYAVRDQRGVRVISDVGFADGLDPGATSTQQIDTLVPPPAGVDPATLTCDVVGIELF